jgi:hypothetical protein
MSLPRGRHRFSGSIAGVGSRSGTRIVVGRWERSPLGAFADVMLAESDGTRVLLAPSDEVAELVSGTYRFDRVEIGEVTAQIDAGTWHVRAPGLDLDFTVGSRSALGWLLRLVPRRLATAPGWARLTDPVARLVLHGVRTRGTAGNDRREYYGATDLRRITGLAGTWQGRELGRLAAVSPEPAFGFGSTPERPSVTELVTTIDFPQRTGPGSP